MQTTETTSPALYGRSIDEARKSLQGMSASAPESQKARAEVRAARRQQKESRARRASRPLFSQLYA